MPKQFRYWPNRAEFVSLRKSPEVAVASQKADLLQGALDLLIRKLAVEEERWDRLALTIAKVRQAT